MRSGAQRRCLWLLVAGAAGCGAAPVQDGILPPGSAPSAPEIQPESEATGTEAHSPVADATPEPPTPEPPGPPPLPAPIETRVSNRTLAVYDATERTREHVRGRIPRGAPFHVYGIIEGPNCRGGTWGQVGREAWACLDRTELSDDTPAVLPVLGEGRLVPGLYARPRREHRASGAPIPRWSSRTSYNAGEPPASELPAHGQFVFARKRYNGGEAVYEDAKRRVVPAAYLWRFSPSEFAGRVLPEAPIAEGLALAWVIDREGAPLHATADHEAEHGAEPGAEPVGELDFHAEVHVRAGTTHGDAWVEVLDAKGRRLGWAPNQALGVWAPPPPFPGVGGDEIWIDVELHEQVLTVMRGEAPIFATLISSGKPGHATPPGTFRVNRKKAYGAMRSQDDDPEPYYVEAVPWSQYYDGGFAIHAAYWHDGFGKRRSHGCVNLSPRDARHVFELTGPRLEPGWIVTFEHEVDPGTAIRVRRGDEHGRDHREPIGPRGDDDPDDDDDDDNDDEE